MKTMTVIGEPEFTLGFQLAGVREVINPAEVNREVKNLLLKDNLGIVIIDEVTINKLDLRMKEEVITSISPVFVTVSKTSAQEELRKMVLQSIGVDLLKND